jgi:hypothetical protein
VTNNELTLLTVTNSATDSDTNLTLTYAVSMTIDTNSIIANGWPLTYVSAAPSPVINANGVITWTPSEFQGPGVYIITTVATDNGTPPTSATSNFRVTVNEVNVPPVFIATPPDQTNSALARMIVTNAATDSDIPTNALTYTLLNPPTGANVDGNGVITWTPTTSQAPGVYTITTIVTDTNQYAVNSKTLSATNSFVVHVLSSAPLTNGVPFTNVVAAGGLVFYQVNVPTNADFATNLLLSATGPLNVWFSSNSPPTITQANDFLLITNAPSGASVLTTAGSPNIVPGGTYYLGLQNTNSMPVTNAIEVSFHLATASPSTNTVPISGIIHTNINGTNGFLIVWFAPSNDLFQVQWTPSLLPTSWTTFTNIIGFDTNVFTSPTNTQFDFFDDGSQTGGFGPFRFYRLILLNSASSGVVPLTNGVPLNFTTPVGATNFFSFDITQTNAAVLFELYNLTGNGDLTLQRSNLPITPPYFASSTNSGTNYEQIVIRTNTGPANINAISWFLGVPNQSPGPISYTIRAALPTNGLLISGLPFNTAAARPGGSNVQLTWGPTVNGEKYEIRTNSNLASTNWVALTDIIAAGTSMTFTDPAPAGAAPILFYRVVQVP